MFIHRELRFAVMSVSLAALAGCESLDNVMGALSSEQAAKVQEESKDEWSVVHVKSFSVGGANHSQIC